MILDDDAWSYYDFWISQYCCKNLHLSFSFLLFQNIPNESLRQELNEIDCLSEDRLTELSNLFLKDFKEGLLDANNWPTFVSAYTVSKALANCCTRILAKGYPSLCINCVCPGFVRTDINLNTGILTTEEGAKGPMILALLPKGSSSGLFFDKTNISAFWEIENGSHCIGVGSKKRWSSLSCIVYQLWPFEKMYALQELCIIIIARYVNGHLLFWFKFNFAFGYWCKDNLFFYVYIIFLSCY